MPYNPLTLTAAPDVTEAWEAWRLSEERVALFYVENAEGERIEYSMPKKPNPGLALRFLKKARTEGELATVWLIEQAIGADGYDALSDELVSYQGDAVAFLQSIVQKIQSVAMGGLEAPKA
jgi:hypothetical protein